MDRDDPVFRKDYYPPSMRLGARDQIADDGIDLADVIADCRMIGSKALKRVVEMRKIDQR